MDFVKVGKFLTELRKEKGLTQEELAKKINIDRSAISKWERGVYLPNAEIIKFLSEFYGVTINELFYGEKLNKKNASAINNLPVILFNDNISKKRMYEVSIIIVIFIAAFALLLVYFLSNYNSIRVYRVSGSSENYMIKNALLVVSKHRTYLKLGNIVSTDNDETNYDSYEIYTMNGEEKIIIDKRNDEDLVANIERFSNYLNYNNQKTYLDNLYIDINNNDDVETIKLNSNLEMTNNKILYISDDNTNDIVDINDELLQESNVSSFIKDNFKYDDNKELYIYSTKVDDQKVEFEYDILNNNFITYTKFDNIDLKYLYVISNQFIYISKYEDGKYNVLCSYDFTTETLTYGNYNKSKKYIDFFKGKIKDKL